MKVEANECHFPKGLYYKFHYGKKQERWLNTYLKSIEIFLFYF